MNISVKETLTAGAEVLVYKGGLEGEIETGRLLRPLEKYQALHGRYRRAGIKLLGGRRLPTLA